MLFYDGPTKYRLFTSKYQQNTDTHIDTYTPLYKPQVCTVLQTSMYENWKHDKSNLERWLLDDNTYNKNNIFQGFFKCLFITPHNSIPGLLGILIHFLFSAAHTMSNTGSVAINLILFSYFVCWHCFFGRMFYFLLIF